MLSKESKIRILENFYALDYVLFSKPVSQIKFQNEGCYPCSQGLVDDYVTSKGALLSTITEMYKMINHQPEKVDKKINTKVLSEMARQSAKVARNNAKVLVCSEDGRNNIKYQLVKNISENKDLNINQEVQKQIRKKAFSLALDNLLVARALNEAEDYSKLNEWEGKFIVEDSYKILRDSVVESALEILENMS